MFHLKSFLKVSGAFLLIFMGVYFLFAFLNVFASFLTIFLEFVDAKQGYNTEEQLGDIEFTLSFIFAFLIVPVALFFITIMGVKIPVEQTINFIKKGIKPTKLYYVFLFIYIFYTIFLANNFLQNKINNIIFSFMISYDNMNFYIAILLCSISTFLTLLIKFILDKRSKHMNRIIDFFLTGIKDFFRASFVGIFTIFIAGLFVIFLHELFWLLGYFGFIDFAVITIGLPFYFIFGLTGLEINDSFLAIGAAIIFAIPALIIYIFILIILAKITMKFLDDFKNKTYSKSFYFIVFLFFNYIYLFIFLGFKKSLYLALISHSKIFELSNENLLFLALAFSLGLISAYLTKIKFFKMRPEDLSYHGLLTKEQKQMVQKIIDGAYEIKNSSLSDVEKLRIFK